MIANSMAAWTCMHCGAPVNSAIDHNCKPNVGTTIENFVVADAQESVLSIRLYNAQQVAADLAARLNDLHREACTAEPFFAESLLSDIGDVNRIEQHLARSLELMEVRK